MNIVGREATKLLNGVKIDKRNIDGDYIAVIDDKIFGVCVDGKENTEVKVRLWN